MKSTGAECGKKVGRRPAEGGEWQENAKKILNRGNELKDLLKTKDLALFGAKNELKTNSILRAKEAVQSEKPDCTCNISGDTSWGLGAGFGKTLLRDGNA
jgi:hypothetical protein